MSKVKDKIPTQDLTLVLFYNNSITSHRELFNIWQQAAKLSSGCLNFTAIPAQHKSIILYSNGQPQISYSGDSEDLDSILDYALTACCIHQDKPQLGLRQYSITY